MAIAFRNLIGGRWIEQGTAGVLEDYSPADTTDLVGVAPRGGRPEVTAAVAAAVEAAPQWGETSPVRRGEVLGRAARLLQQRSGELAQLISREMGKPLQESRGEVNATVSFFDYFAGEGYRFRGETLPASPPNVTLLTVREPLGVVGLITPWNFPISMPAKKIAAALVCGNAVVLKPASQTPGIATMLVEILVEAGVPQGIINLVTGPGGDTGEALTSHPSVRAVSFTGSTEVGKIVARLAHSIGARVQAEMGGKNAAIVLEDGDLDRAVALIVAGAFRSAGQKCTATSRIIVQSAVYDPFIRRLVEATEQVKVGDPMDEQTIMGPVVDAQQMESILRHIAIGRVEGAELLMGGERLTSGIFSKGFYVAPTIFGNVDADMTIAREEIFGPVLAVSQADTFDEALALLNRTRYGLSGTVHTASLLHAMKFMRKAEVGCVGINTSTAGWEIQAPFGGTKDSGVGPKDQGSLAIDFFSELKTVAIAA